MSLIITKEFVNDCKRIGYLKHVALEAVDQLESKDKQIAELKAENRKLKRALYKACANWARSVRFSRCKGDRQLHRNSKNLQTKSLLPKCKDEAWITERKCEEAK